MLAVKHTNKRKQKQASDNDYKRMFTFSKGSVRQTRFYQQIEIFPSGKFGDARFNTEASQNLVSRFVGAIKHFLKQCYPMLTFLNPFGHLNQLIFKLFIYI